MCQGLSLLALWGSKMRETLETRLTFVGEEDCVTNPKDVCVGGYIHLYMWTTLFQESYYKLPNEILATAPAFLAIHGYIIMKICDNIVTARFCLALAIWEKNNIFIDFGCLSFTFHSI